MAHAKRNPGADVAALFEEGAHGWNFFALVRHLEASAGAGGSGGEGLGHTQHPADDPVRFRQELTLAFPPAEVSGYAPRRGELPPALSIFCFGLLGCGGPMPLGFSEYLLERVRHHGDHALKNFLDMFHHRMISLYYRSWAKNQQTVSFERSDDPIGRHIGSLVGRGNASARPSDGIPGAARLFFAGRLIHPTVNAEGLAAILSGYFRTPARITQFIPQWIEIPETDRCRLGESEETGTLAESWILGARIRDRQQKFRITLGPMGYDRYRKLTPGSRGFAHLAEWLRGYVGLNLDWEVRLVLKAEEVPPLKAGSGVRLGYTTWMRREPRGKDADDLVLGSRHSPASPRPGENDGEGGRFR